MMARATGTLNNIWAFIQTAGIDKAHYWENDEAACGIKRKQDDTIWTIEGARVFICKQCGTLMDIEFNQDYVAACVYLPPVTVGDNG